MMAIHNGIPTSMLAKATRANLRYESISVLIFSESDNSFTYTHRDLHEGSRIKKSRYYLLLEMGRGGFEPRSDVLGSLRSPARDLPASNHAGNRFDDAARR